MTMDEAYTRKSISVCGKITIMKWLMGNFNRFLQRASDAKGSEHCMLSKTVNRWWFGSFSLLYDVAEWEMKINSLGSSIELRQN